MPPQEKKTPSVCMMVRSDYISDSRVRREAETLVQNGFKVHVIALNLTPMEETVIDGVSVQWVTEPRIPRWRSWHLRYALFRILSVISLNRGAFICMKRRADVIHAHDLNTLKACAIAASLTGAKLIYDSHELYTECGPNIRKSDWEPLERKYIRRAHAVITVNRPIAEELSRRYGVPIPHVIRNCPRLSPDETTSNALHEKAGIPIERKIVLFQGYFMNGRGLEQLFAAMASVRPEAVLVMLGWGASQPALEQLAASLNLAHRIFFIARVPVEELIHNTASAHVGVIPYRNTCLNNYYCLPNKIFEYMMAGIPMAVSNFPVISEIVQKHNCGVVFDPESPASIADAINSLLDDEARRREMGRNGRLASENELNWNLEARKLLAVYDSINGVKRPRTDNA